MYEVKNISVEGMNSIVRGFIKDDRYFFTKETLIKILNMKKIKYSFDNNKFIIDINNKEFVSEGIFTQNLLSKYLIYYLDNDICKCTPYCCKAQFSMEGFNEKFIGYTYGETWNGWNCPYFTKNECKKILSSFIDTNEDSGFYLYDEKNDRFIVNLSIDKKSIESNWKEEFLKLSDEEIMNICEEMEIYNKLLIQYKGKDIHIYGLGGFTWAWDIDKYIMV